MPVFRLAPGVRLRRAAGADALLVPEGIVSLSGSAAAIVELLDGARDDAAIASLLAERFEADPVELQADVADLLRALLERGFLRT